MIIKKIKNKYIKSQQAILARMQLCKKIMFFDGLVITIINPKSTPRRHT